MKHKENFKAKLKRFLIRKQNFIYGTMAAVGIGLMTLHQEQFSIGVAFLTVGLVGLLMSWTTMDIGDSIKAKIDELKTPMNNMATSMNTMATSMNNMATSMNNMATSMNNMATSMNTMAATLTRIETLLSKK